MARNMLIVSLLCRMCTVQSLELTRNYPYAGLMPLSVALQKYVRVLPEIREEEQTLRA